MRNKEFRSKYELPKKQKESLGLDNFPLLEVPTPRNPKNPIKYKAIENLNTNITVPNTKKSVPSKKTKTSVPNKKTTKSEKSKKEIKNKPAKIQKDRKLLRAGIILTTMATATATVATVAKNIEYNTALDDKPSMIDTIKSGIDAGIPEKDVLEDLGTTRNIVKRILTLQSRNGIETTNRKDLLNDSIHVGLDSIKMKIAHAVSENTGLPVDPSNVHVQVKEDGIVNIIVRGVCKYIDDRYIIEDNLFGYKTIPKEVIAIGNTIGDMQGIENASVQDIDSCLTKISSFVAMDVKINENGDVECVEAPYDECEKVDYDVSYPDYVTPEDSYLKEDLKYTLEKDDEEER